MSIAQTIDKFTNNLRAVFTDKQISLNVTYTYVQNFKDAIGFRPLLEQHLQQYNGLKAPNSTYSIADALDFMVDAAFQRIIEHIQKALRQFRLHFGTG